MLVYGGIFVEYLIPLLQNRFIRGIKMIPPKSPNPNEETQQFPRVYVHPKTRPGSNLVPHEIPWALEFRMIESGEAFHVPVRSAITIGRSDQERNVRPDVDLAPHDGYQKGVSRRHAIIMVRDDHLVLRGLSTTNGTWLNGVLLATGEESALSDGDELMIGRLPLLIGFIAAPATSRR
jgi:hypothetical protein